MLAVSKKFKNAMKQPVKELEAYITGDNDNIRSADDLISFKISCESDMCKTAMRKLEAKYLGEHNLLGQWVRVGYGVKLDSGTFEYLDYGSFLVTEMTSIKDTGVSTIVGYDKMINSMKEYTKLNIEYPINLLDYTEKLCEACGLELNDMVPNVSIDINSGYLYSRNLNLELNTDNGCLFSNEQDIEIINGYLYGETHKSGVLFNTQITKELWENISGITYRDILVQIAQATATTCIVSNDDKVYFKPLTTTEESLTYDNMFKLKLEPKYGEINSVVLSRTPQEDNIYMRDEDSIKNNGLTEFKIENNEIIDKDRDNVIAQIYEALHGISYYPFEATTEGLGWYEIGDNFDIINDTGDVFNTSLFNFSINIDGGIKEILKTSASTKTQTQYQYARTIDKRIKNTEIIVNKQEEYIKSLVSDMYDENGKLNQNFSEVYQDLYNIIQSIQTSGGNNLIKNSVMFAYDNNKNPTDWEIDSGGTLSMNSSAESLGAGCLSGHIFVIENKKVRQKVNVSPNNYYTFSTKIKKNATGSCYVKLYNSNEEHIIEIPIGENVFYKDYELKALLPKDNYYIIEFYGSADSDATFTDNMLALGQYKTQWQQANGEIMNTQVNVNLDGVLVKSSVYLGDYTVMSPLEFAGYSNINGTVTKVFSLNKDVTLVKKLEAEDEVKMVPIKIVPVTSGSLQGWAFVQSS